MTPEKWIEVKEIFNEAVELSIAERERFLTERINGDSELRGAVEKLLASDERAETLFDGKSLLAADGFSGAEQIGNYRVERKIGEGGMGAVFLAERLDTKQKVALKIIRRAAASEVILKRFRREQEILAQLEHPKIARLLDVGVSHDGTPFLAMEYVEGKDLSDYCREKNLSVAERLKLFRKICEAVAYAHSRLVVHRDLKPSNIIINEAGEPKLLDFGISKLLDETESNEKGTVTSFGMLTPNYASPEQFRGETVSTATDVYSLGVILFEMLTGELPYRIGDKRFDEAARIVCDTNPVRPSSVVSGQWSVVGKTSNNNGRRTTDDGRKTNPQPAISNPKSLRGDLDNIILKSLRKEPDRRYSSVEQFSEDVRRHLEGLPVAACPDTFAYRAEKFIGRNRVPVFSAALVFLILIAGVVGIAWQYVRAERERRLAEQRFAQVRELANKVVFKYYDEIEKLPGSTKLRETLVTDALQYLDSLSQDAAGDASLQKELAQAYLRIAKVQDKHYEPNLGDNNAAIESNRKAASLLEPLAEKSNDPQIQTALAGSYIELASNMRRQGNSGEAGELLQKAIAVNERNVAANPNSVDSQIAFAQNLIYYGDLTPEAENNPAYQKALDISENVWRLNPADAKVPYFLCATTGRIADGLMMQAQAAREAEDFDREKKLRDQAAPFYRRSVEVAEKIYAADSTSVINRSVLTIARFNESTLQAERGQFDAALETQQKTLREYQQILAADADNQETENFLADIYCTLGSTYGEQGDGAKSAENFLASLQTLDKIIAKQPDNFEARKKKFDYANLYADELLKRGDEENARRNYRQAFAQIEAAADEKNKSAIESARETYLEKTGDCDLAVALKTNLSAASRRAALNDALASFQKAVELCRQIGAEKTARLTILEHKINRCQELPAKL